MSDPVDGRWLLVIPPEGAARQVGENLWAAMESVLPGDRRKRFDTLAHLRAFDGWLKRPDDDLVVDLAGQSLIVQALDFAATHVIVVALSPITFFTANLLKRQGLKTVHWFVEDFRQARYWEKVLPAYTHWFAIQRGPMEMACRNAGVRFAYLPTGAGRVSGDSVKPWDRRRFDVSFVGFPSAYRVQALESVAAMGVSLAIGGSGWEKYSGPLEAHLVRRGWMDASETSALLAEARVGLHLSVESPESDRVSAHVSPRIFDVLNGGSALACEDVPACRDALDGFAVTYFQGPGAAAGAVRECLLSPVSIGEQTARRRLVAERHGYVRRFQTLLTLAAM